ncbi:hypothetical protein EYC84_008140 [Monilinia fructicola]|uniref:Uncharacterized protein n=1 Tax=Monilinia fructicola TaxID=38448 RepID=A0A5M9JFZ5_MONFR|nr:hypothetical protein EYC84_008140 [Monilinia fructicola]
MWKKQIRAERAAEKASEMVARARALSEAASIQTPGTHSSKANDGSTEVSEYEADNHSNRTLVAPTLATRALARTAESRVNDDSSSSRSTSSSSDSDGHKSDEDKKVKNAYDKKNVDKPEKSNDR